MYNYSTYGSGYGYGSSGLSGMAGSAVWTIIAAVLAVVGGFVLYFTFLAKKNEGKFTGFLGWMYDFLSFKKLVIENILKICYLILALFITLSSFALIGSSFLGFILMLVLGNLGVRIAYELFLVVLVICKNTTEINSKMKAEKKEDEDK